MVLKTVTYYQAVCDGCSKTYDEGEYSAWSDQSAASDDAVDSGNWKRDDDDKRHWCRNCQKCDTEHVRNEEDECSRCGEELESLEDHTG